MSERSHPTRVPQDDRLLALLPADRPPAFDRLAFDEQQWRGRVFLMTFTFSGNVAFSWWQALRDDPEDPGGAAARAFVATVDDEEIAFRVAEAAQGRWYGPPE